MHRLTIPAASLVIAMATAACGSGPSSAPPTPASTAAPDRGQPTPVRIEKFAFAPEAIDIPLGTTVTWTNVDATQHTVTAGTPEQPDKGTFDHAMDDRDATFSFTFNRAGTYDYHCVLHPFMRGTITVAG